MSFVCPECMTSGSLRITHKIELPPDSAWDEITLQIVGCSQCKFEGVAVYQESRRGALGSEIWHHRGYRMEKEDLAALRAAMEACPAPSNPRCQCRSHLSLGRRSAESGRWAGVSGLDWEVSFPMQMAR